MRPFFIALQFLTRLPAPVRAPPQPTEIGQSLVYYPWVGAVLGALLVAIATLAQAIWPAPLAAALTLTAWVWLTGALHLDGLADSVDAWAGGGRERDRTLAIMQDPCSGPMAVSAVVLILLVKATAVYSLLTTGAWAALAFVPVLARSAVPVLFLTTPCARPHGLGATLAAHLPRRAAWISALAGGASGLLLGAAGWVAILGAIALLVYWRAQMLRRIGGVTGDTAGALVEWIETVVLVCVVAIGVNMPISSVIL